LPDWLSTSTAAKTTDAADTETGEAGETGAAPAGPVTPPADTGGWQQWVPDWLSGPLGLPGPGSSRTSPGMAGAEAATGTAGRSGDSHLQLATESLRQLLDDKRIPDKVREHLQQDYGRVRDMLSKLEHGHIHIAVFGRVSVGKSSLLNALIGKPAFSVSVLHGETRASSMESWEEYEDGGLYLIDTPGINEVEGEERERMAHEVASRADLVLFVVDSDLTDVELKALRLVTNSLRPTLLVVNKADRYTETEQRQLRTILRERTHGLIAPENLIFTTSQPTRQVVIHVDEQGEEQETVRVRPVEVQALKTRLWDILEAEGKTLSALNASLFAGSLSNEIGQRVLEVKHDLGQRTIRFYCLTKGVAVALNPIPVADILAAIALDVTMIVHLSRLYGLPMSRTEAGELIRTIIKHMLLLIGITWTINLASSALKLGTGGLSTLLTGATQGAVAWYSTLVIGSVAERWLANGKSWGDSGPKFVVQQIIDSLDRDSVVSEAREEIMNYLKNTVRN